MCEAFPHLLNHSLCLRRGGEPGKLPNELPKRQISPTFFGVAYVAEDQHLQRLGTVPMRTRRLARHVLLERTLVGRFVNFDVFGGAALTLVRERRMGVESGKRPRPVKGVEVLHYVVVLVAIYRGYLRRFASKPSRYLKRDGGTARFQQHLSRAVVEVHRTSRVDPRPYPVANTLRLDDERLARAKGIRYADDGLERVALCATSRRTVRRLVADANVVVEDLAHDISR